MKKATLRRVEIIYSQALIEDILGAISKVAGAEHYSIVPGVRGKGYSTPKMGDAVWPEINELMIIYCDDKAVPEIEEAIGKVQKRYPGEGVAFFVL